MNSPTQTVDVGTPRRPSGWHLTTIHFHSFETLPHEKGDCTDSRPFRMHGLDWYLRIHPGGATSAKGDDMVSLYLRCKSAAERNISVYAEFSLSLVRNDGQVDCTMSCPCNAFKRKRKGWPNFILRSRILDRSSQLLNYDSYGGTLTVLVKVQLFEDRRIESFVPKNNMNVKLLSLLDDANRTNHITGQNSDIANAADVTFSVEDETIQAHSLILKMAAPALAYMLCDDADPDTPIPIIGVRHHIFWLVLRYAYGDDIPDDIWTAKSPDSPFLNQNTNEWSSLLSLSPALEILDAANRFGVVGLKLLAESKNRANRDIDAKDCALLKEKVMDFFVAHAEDIRATQSFHKIEESAHVMVELMDALLSKRMLRSFSLGENDVEYSSMGVNLLRTQLEERGLDVDGSRETLIKRLEIWDREKTESGSEGDE
ncbi:hypothetical protein ACHAWO_000342 [Cyclotella atomus]|uniref:Uncharacterized protein n=1 Tax=Cyclotella atomus TaxID=382360 RepID=A0ABD3MT53_9STRA